MIGDDEKIWRDAKAAEPAFGHKSGGGAPGISRREYFAAAALTGLLAGGSRGTTQDIANTAVGFANAMIRASDMDEDAIREWAKGAPK